MRYGVRSHRCGLDGGVLEAVALVTHNEVKGHALDHFICPHKHLVANDEHRVVGQTHIVLHGGRRAVSVDKRMAAGAVRVDKRRAAGAVRVGT